MAVGMELIFRFPGAQDCAGLDLYVGKVSKNYHIGHTETLQGYM